MATCCKCRDRKKGRTDALLTDHQPRILELLVFFRRNRYEHPGAGFQYLGPFVYAMHEGSGPTNVVLRRANAEPTGGTVADEQFDPKDLEDGRRWIQLGIAERRGQRTFRNGLLASYVGRYAISGCAVSDILSYAPALTTHHRCAARLLRSAGSGTAAALKT